MISGARVRVCHPFDECGNRSRPSLEALAFYYGTDKSHDDHKYSDLCISICGASTLD